jgi:hypothetical protein
VLKLFKLYRRRLPDGLMRIPLSSSLEAYRQKKLNKKNRKLHRDFSSYRLAFKELKEETSLLYVHINLTDYLQQKVSIVDKLGILHAVPLDSLVFVLQNRATLAHEHLNHLMIEGKKEEAEASLLSLLKSVSDRYQKGILDEDAVIERNFGFIGNQSILIDAGRLKMAPSYLEADEIRRDSEKTFQPFQKWLELSHPSLATYLEENYERFF